DGESAYQRAIEGDFDMLLSDVMMPKLDGFQLIERLRAHGRTKTMQMILVSARAGEDSRIEGLRAGADDFLIKPFSAKELIARVRTHLELGRLRMAAESERNTLHNVFMRAPMGVVIYHGPALEIDFINPTGERHLGAYARVGLTFDQANPDLVDSDFRRIH